MNIRPLAAIASVALLCACNSNQGNSAGNTSSSNSAGTAAGGGTATTGTTGAGGTGGTGGGSAKAVDPQLEQEISQAVQMLKPQLPLRQQTPQGELRVTNIEARGGELVYTMEVPTDLDQTKFEAFRDRLPQQACANPTARQMFERGGSYTYLLRDPGGEEFTTSVSSC